MGIIFLLFVFLWFFLLYKCIKAFKKINKEKKYYKIMLSNLCDSSVLEYIDIFNKSNQGVFVSLLNMQNAVNHRNNLIRQSQAWEIIKDNTNVSGSVKEQLKTAFISNGVSIKM